MTATTLLGVALLFVAGASLVMRFWPRRREAPRRPEPLRGDRDEFRLVRAYGSWLADGYRVDDVLELDSDLGRGEFLVVEVRDSELRIRDTGHTSRNMGRS